MFAPGKVLTHGTHIRQSERMDFAQFLTNFVSAIDGLEGMNITLDTKLHSLGAWDSLAILSTLAMVDSEYSVQISGIEVNSASTVRDIANIVAKKI